MANAKRSVMAGAERCLRVPILRVRVREPHATSVRMPSLRELTKGARQNNADIPQTARFSICSFRSVHTDCCSGERGARPLAGAVDGDFAEWNCCGGIASGCAGGRANTGTRRECRGCGDRGERDDGCCGADDERHRRRFVCDRL